MGGWPILECYSEIILLRGVDGWLRQGEVAAEAVSMLRGNMAEGLAEAVWAETCCGSLNAKGNG